jgi:hypothetical protein
MTNRQDVSNLVVCRYFLRSEFAKGTFPADPSAFTDEEIRREMTAFGQNLKHSSNPAVVRLGFSRKGGKAAEKWKHIREIDVRLIISKGLNKAWNPALQGVNGNLYRFWTECQTTYKAEYDRTDLPSAELSLIIGILHPSSPNEIELIDGSHRLASLILKKNITSVEGYVGFFEPC